MKGKKNNFWRFVCSLIPGAAEMYMGFMKLGLSLMLTFFGLIIVASVLHLTDIFVVIPIVVWLYSFFHAHNMASMGDEKLENYDDHFILEEYMDDNKVVLKNKKIKKGFAISLIVIGVISIWNNITDYFYAQFDDFMDIIDYEIIQICPQIIVAILVIVLGIVLLTGKKEKKEKMNGVVKQDE